MANTGLDVFDETIQKTNALLRDIEQDLGWQGHRSAAYGALRAVLHTLRDRLTVEEAANLAAQLPLLVKGIFYEGWNPARVPRKMDRAEFLEEIGRNVRFSSGHSSAEVTSTVWIVLQRYVSEGEAEDVLAALPRRISEVLELGEALV